jgi:hypothetical protein
MTLGIAKKTQIEKFRENAGGGDADQDEDEAARIPWFV